MLQRSLDLILIAQAQTDPAWYQTKWGIVLIVLAVMSVPFLLGGWIARRLRMADYGWKFSTILFALIASIVILLMGRFKLGIDLAGGTELVYRVDVSQLSEEEKDEMDDLMDRLVRALRKRVEDRLGLHESRARAKSRG